MAKSCRRALTLFQLKEGLMPNAIDRHEVQRLLAEQQAQLVEVLPEAEFEDEHLPGRSTSRSRPSTASARDTSIAGARSSSTATTTSET
jgi:rhodanese-related sulfurtransferase